MSPEPSQISTQTLDEAEPQAGRSPTPILLIGLFALLAFWGMTHIDTQGGGFAAKVYFPIGDGAQLEAAQFHDPAAEFRLRGAKIFSANCAACHQASGMGLPGQFPPLAGSDWVNAKTANRVARIVLYGLNGPLVLNGQPFNTSAQMVPFKDSLSDEDIAAVLTFVRSNKDWHNDAPAVTPEMVKSIRDKVKTHVGPFNPADLTKLSDTD
jgi:mono/diheme cytochrome c family protein